MPPKLERMPSYVHTYSGLMVDPLDLQPEDVCIEDIAHHLANQCRWSGATKYHYSVAQHAVLCSQVIDKPFKWDALHHDDAEYILQDMAKPLKNDPYFGQAYRGAEARAEKVIGEVFGVTFPFVPEVKEVDILLLVTEARDLMHGTKDWTYYTDIEPLKMEIKPWTPKRAEREFLARYEQLKDTLVEGHPGRLG